MRIGYIIASGRELTTEERAGWEFLVSQRRSTSKRLRFDRLPPVEELRETFDILWWHSDLPLPDRSGGPSSRTHDTLRTFVERGGALFLSLLPAGLPVTLGFERQEPQTVQRKTWDQESWAKGYPDIRGFATFRGHPVFHGLTGGLYSWMPKKGDPFCGAFYDASVPADGKVIAVERQYIRIIPSQRIAWEYSPGKGRIVCIGTYLFFAETHPRVRPHLETFTANCFSYLTSSRRRIEPTSHWSFETTPPSRTERHSPPVEMRGRSEATVSSGPSIDRRLTVHEAGQAFDVGGRRCVIVGHERRGIREVWYHPVRGLQNLRLGVETGDGTFRWLEESDLNVEIHPDACIRTATFGPVSYTEQTFAHPTAPAGAVMIRTHGGPSRLWITAEIDLRLMWPLDERATGPLHYAWDDGLQAAVVSVASGETAAILGSSVRPAATYVGNPERLLRTAAGSFDGTGSSDRIVQIGMIVDLGPERSAVTIGFAGSGTSEREAGLAYRELMEDPASIRARQSRDLERLQTDLTMLHFSDDVVRDAYRWALAGTDRFFLTTPGIGSSYVAGYGTVDRGWNGGHAVSGRPGYAWYFGRDAIWTAFSALATGDFEKVRAVLAFLAQHQDVRGKILHELTTSGFVHYDAADATPLYIILLGRYVRASGHRSFARSAFPSLRKALDFCFSTDTDGDGLIENTNVGHGWVEGGALFPVHTEQYLAACWSAALGEASFLAGVVGHPHLSNRWNTASTAVKEIIEKDFWDESSGRYAFAKNEDGTYNHEHTVLPTVGLYLGVCHGDRARRALRPFSSADFTTDWGVRIVGAGNPLFNPTGYHYGSVWPLFTGWTSLAEFRHDRPLQGFLHVLSTAMTYRHHAAGCVEEVLHGETFDPAGVCHRQAWSESMVVQPLTEGMLGIDANGLDHSVRLAPWLPPHWSSFRATRIRVGQSWLTLNVERGEQTTDVELSLEGRNPITAELALRFPLGTHVRSIDMAGHHQRPDRVLAAYDQAPTLTVRVTSSVRIVFSHTGGCGLVPPLPDLRPGERSSGIRVIDETFHDGQYMLELEGIGGSSYDLEVIHRGRKLSDHDGCELLETYVGRSKIRVAFPGDGVYTRTTVSLS